MQRGKGEIVLLLQHRAQGSHGFFGLRLVHDAADPLQLDAARRLASADQRLPDVLLAAVERFVGVGAVAQRIGLAEGQDGVDRARTVVTDLVDGIIGEAAKRKIARVDFFALALPFFGHGIGQCLGGHDLRRSALRFYPTPVEQHAPAAIGLFDRHILPEALHSGDFQRLASRSGIAKNSNAPNTSRP